jgi:site-specific recombinase XerD
MNTETRRLYTRHQQRWIEWCASQGLDPVTPPADRIAGYIRELGAAFARSTVQQHCAAIMAYHRAAGVETSPVQSFTMRHVLRDIHHASKKPQGKLPLNSYNLRRIMAPESPSPNRLKLLRDRALFALGGYFRAGELFQLETSHIVAASTSAMTFR